MNAHDCLKGHEKDSCEIASNIKKVILQQVLASIPRILLRLGSSLSQSKQKCEIRLREI